MKSACFNFNKTRNETRFLVHAWEICALDKIVMWVMAPFLNHEYVSRESVCRFLSEKYVPSQVWLSLDWRRISNSTLHFSFWRNQTLNVIREGKRAIQPHLIFWTDSWKFWIHASPAKIKLLILRKLKSLIVDGGPENHESLQNSIWQGGGKIR